MFVILPTSFIVTALLETSETDSSVQIRLSTKRWIQFKDQFFSKYANVTLCTVWCGAVIAALASSTSTAAADWFPYKVELTEPLASGRTQKSDFDYVPLTRANKKWHLCVSFPHLKDAYWLGVNFGVTEEAKRQGVKVEVLDAGGYDHLDTQKTQIEDCVQRGAQAVVIGAISGDGLNDLIKKLALRDVPVIDIVNGIYSRDLTAKSLVSFYDMGKTTGGYLAARHPLGSPPAKVGWFPGPLGAAWVESAHQGFMEATRDSALVVLEPRYGDTGIAKQTQLVTKVLNENKALAYVAGTGVTAEAAVPLLRASKRTETVKVVAFYTTPGVIEGIKRGSILAAPADSMVVQGRVGVDQAIRALEQRPLSKHVGPKIFMVDSSNVQRIDLSNILPPANFKPIFMVNGQ